MKEFRQANEERYTHRYQTPYYHPDGDHPQVVQQDSGSHIPELVVAAADTVTTPTHITTPIGEAETGSSGRNSSVSIVSQNA